MSATSRASKHWHVVLDDEMAADRHAASGGFRGPRLRRCEGLGRSTIARACSRPQAMTARPSAMCASSRSGPPAPKVRHSQMPRPSPASAIASASTCEKTLCGQE